MCKRVVSAAASPPTESLPQYSPALFWVTTGFGMGPGGSRTLSATDTTLSPTHLVRNRFGYGMGGVMEKCLFCTTLASTHAPMDAGAWVGGVVWSGVGIHPRP